MQDGDAGLMGICRFRLLVKLSSLKDKKSISVRSKGRVNLKIGGGLDSMLSRTGGRATSRQTLRKLEYKLQRQTYNKLDVFT